MNFTSSPTSHEKRINSAKFIFMESLLGDCMFDYSTDVMRGPYHAKSSAIFNRIPLGQVEPKVILTDGTEWLQSFDKVKLAWIDDRAQTTEEEVAFDEVIDDIEANGDQFGDICDEEEIKELMAVVTDIATPSQSRHRICILLLFLIYWPGMKTM
jgi:hypothetical protein